MIQAPQVFSMKLQHDTTVILFSKNPTRKIPQTTLLLIAFAIIFTITSICHPSLQNSIIRLSRSISQFTLSTNGDEMECDLFKGQWVRNRGGPYYTNETCNAIQEHQNCIKNGRPDLGFTKWRWQPDGCELEVFDPVSFLSFMRGKSLAFVGDSVARNHVQSLICLLSKVTHPIDASNNIGDQDSRRWEYKDYNFNISIFWSPYLVRTQRTDPNDVTRPFNLYLDEFDKSWTSQIKNFDYVIISAAQWFFRPSMYYVKRRLVGCLYCSQNITQYSADYGYQSAFRTAFRAINTVKKYKGVTLLRTYAPSHFENGKWDKGGSCPRKRPYKRNKVLLDDYNLKINDIQGEEFKIAEKIGRIKGLRFRLLNVTHVMLLRPDGHPNKYGHGPGDVHPKEGLVNDCVHWCLPGPIDTWNDFLLEMVKRESKMGRSSSSGGFNLH